MNRKKIKRNLEIFAICLFIFTICLGTYLYIKDPYVFCLEGKGAVDLEDQKNCFKTIGELKEHAEYLSKKYNNTEEKPLMEYNLNIS